MALVRFPDSTALFLNFLPRLELGKQKSSQKIGWKVARPDIDPAVFIDLAAEELASVGALFSNNQSAFHQLRIVHQQRAALATGHVLGFVKALRGQTSEGAGELSPIAREESVRIVFHDSDSVARGDGADRIHFAGHAG